MSISNGTWAKRGQHTAFMSSSAKQAAGLRVAIAVLGIGSCHRRRPIHRALYTRYECLH